MTHIRFVSGSQALSGDGSANHAQACESSVTVSDLEAGVLFERKKNSLNVCRRAVLAKLSEKHMSMLPDQSSFPSALHAVPTTCLRFIFIGCNGAYVVKLDLLRKSACLSLTLSLSMCVSV